MITIQISCSCCGKQLRDNEGDATIELEHARDISSDSVERLVKDRGWKVQRNGEYLDTYCSQTCAR